MGSGLGVVTALIVDFVWEKLQVFFFFFFLIIYKKRFTEMMLIMLHLVLSGILDQAKDPYPYPSMSDFTMLWFHVFTCTCIRGF